MRAWLRTNRGHLIAQAWLSIAQVAVFLACLKFSGPGVWTQIAWFQMLLQLEFFWERTRTLRALPPMGVEVFLYSPSAKCVNRVVLSVRQEGITHVDTHLFLTFVNDYAAKRPVSACLASDWRPATTTEIAAWDRHSQSRVV